VNTNTEPGTRNREHVVVVGTSTRAAAESAARAGFDVTAIDAFGDLDQHADVRALSLPRDFTARPTAQAGARAARTIQSDAVVYLSSFENHPRAVASLAAGRALWGNSPDVLRRTRDPLVVADALRARGFETPKVRRTASAEALAITKADPAYRESEWLLKPLQSGGGHRIRRWAGRHVPRCAYLQEYLDGVPGSVVFVAAGRQVVPLGVSRQLIGEPAFGASGYRYCGSILAAGPDAPFSPAVVDRACALARAAGEAFGLIGVNGIDFIARDDEPQAIEINPRWTASMELVERLFTLSVFRAHADACSTGALPSFDLAAALRDGGTLGKAVVFAREPVTMGDTRAWLGDATVRDVPHPGERIGAGQPICTVLAAAVDAQRCHAALVRRADEVYASLAVNIRAVRP
jgi:predicted ATP-grasp superfamily ATP-dependent carboligase